MFQICLLGDPLAPVGRTVGVKGRDQRGVTALVQVSCGGGCRGERSVNYEYIYWMESGKDCLRTDKCHPLDASSTRNKAL